MAAIDDEFPETDAITAERVDVPGPDTALLRPEDNLPKQLIALPLNQRPVFPTMMLPLVIPEGRLATAIQMAVDKADGYVGLFMTKTQLEEGNDYRFEDLHAVGCVARVMKVSHHEESGGVQLLGQVMGRFRIDRCVGEDPHVVVTGEPITSRVDPEAPEVRAHAMAIVTALKDLVQHNPVFADEIKMVLANFNNIDGPGRLADLAASLTTAGRDELQLVLETIPVVPRMERVLNLLAKESELAELKSKIRSQINERVSDHQRKFFLGEQLKAIKEELGLETDEKSLEMDRLRKQLEAKREFMSDEAVQATEEELRKISLLEPASSEYGVARNRLEWLLGMPWGDFSKDNLDLASLRQGLDDDHYGLDDIKDRIIEFCAVRRLKQDRGGGILCLAGPPGTGKTSVGASIARQLGRKFYRLSVGGMRDEAEIKGHRRTYVGALPGKLAQALRRCETMNPVILLDEIDKLSRGMQGDPASALLEVLDPEQNKDFLDHYLDVRVDLSQVLFVCTANDLGGIPEPLRDRMEIIRLAGYVEDEKVAIASKYLVPKQRKAHGLLAKDISFSKSALKRLTTGYAREAGVRQLEQLVARVCRKVATAKARYQSDAERRKAKRSRAKVAPWAKVAVNPDNLVDYLGKPHMSDEELIARSVPGVVTGLAWTAMGGATLEIEAVAIATEAGKGSFQLTGQLGDVMKESATLARNYLRAECERFAVGDWFDRHLVHVHVPAGATPKDGPSAGVTMATAMLSLALGRPVKRRLGMTGELTLTGRVYPIGGVREKIVAARRSGLKTVLLPMANERDFAELPDYLKDRISVYFVEHLDEVLKHAGLTR
ncbi:MAG: endopeptidase La [Planctomycetota bacterium]|jgi:ATP-dependent Lon protease|nr:endopeptidase La [Planctomycetota bacterium]